MLLYSRRQLLQIRWFSPISLRVKLNSGKEGVREEGGDECNYFGAWRGVWALASAVGFFKFSAFLFQRFTDTTAPPPGPPEVIFPLGVIPEWNLKLTRDEKPEQWEPKRLGWAGCVGSRPMRREQRAPWGAEFWGSRGKRRRRSGLGRAGVPFSPSSSSPPRLC